MCSVSGFVVDPVATASGGAPSDALNLASQCRHLPVGVHVAYSPDEVAASIPLWLRLPSARKIKKRRKVPGRAMSGTWLQNVFVSYI